LQAYRLLQHFVCQSKSVNRHFGLNGLKCSQLTVIRGLYPAHRKNVRAQRKRHRIMLDCPREFEECIAPLGIRPALIESGF
jgi:hypothetical protein